MPEVEIVNLVGSVASSMLVEQVIGVELDKTKKEPDLDDPVLEVVKQEKEAKSSGVPEDYQSCRQKEVLLDV